MMNYISLKYVKKELLECHQIQLLLGSQMFYQGMPLTGTEIDVKLSEK